MTYARASIAFLIAASIAGCAIPGGEGWTFTAAPPMIAAIQTSETSYALDLGANVSSWTGAFAGKPPRETTLVYDWGQAPGLVARVGMGDTLTCSPGENGVAGEGDGYAWTIQPRDDGCRIALVLVSQHRAEDISWRIDGWAEGTARIRATLTVESHRDRVTA